MLSKCSDQLKTAVVTSMEIRLVSRKSIVLASRPIAEGMYIIISGSVTINSDKDRSMRILNCGDSFAEFALFEECVIDKVTDYGGGGSGGSSSYNLPLLKNPYEVRAQSDCEVWFISRVKWEELLRKYPGNRSLLPVLQKKALSVLRQGNEGNAGHRMMLASVKSVRKMTGKCVV